MFLAARDDDGTPMSPEQLRDECKTMFLAGHETTALTMSWSLWLLATHPDIQRRLADEIRTVIGHRMPTLEDIRSLPFTEQVIREAMRLYPPAWVLQRESLSDVSLGPPDDPYSIPKEHDVLVSPAAMHRDPRFYAHPDRFMPNRWTPEFIAALPKYAYFPFGGGPRLCIGQQFAMMEATLLLAQCIQRGHWEAKPLHRVVAQPSITQRPKYGIQLRYKPHVT
jgi:cytochrome P450